MISLTDYLMGRDALYPEEFLEETRANAIRTVAKMNSLYAVAALDGCEPAMHPKVNSGWRPSAVNDATSNAAKRSTHITAEACDTSDPDGELDRWCLSHLDVLERIGLWMEHPGWTDGWNHLQTRPPGDPPDPSKRVYLPSNNPPSTTVYGRLPFIRKPS